MNLDEVPAVASAASDAFPPDAIVLAEQEEVPEEELFADLGPEELLKHPNWKARKYAFEQALKLVDDSKPFVMPMLGTLIKETNAAALEALLELVLAILETCNDDEVVLLCDATVKVVVEKGLLGRPKTARLSAEILSFFCLGGQATLVAELLLHMLSSRVPKNRLAAVQTLTSLVSEYGVMIFPMKQLFKSLTPLFNDVDGKVRKQTMQLCCQCFRFTGPSINNYLTDLRDVQRQELEQHFKSIEVGAKPEKVVRNTPLLGQQDGDATFASSASSRGAPRTQRPVVGASTPAADPLGDSPTEESPVISRLPKNFYAVALDKACKWQDRVAIVNDTLLPLLSAARLKSDDDYTDLCKAIRDLLNDAQAPIMAAGFKAVQALGCGLGTGFAPYVRFLVPPVMDKLREKKTATFEAVCTTIRALLGSGALVFDALQEEIDQAANSKIPHHRMNAISFVLRFIPGEDPARLMRLSRSPMHISLVGDEKVEVRDGALSLIGQLLPLCGDAPFKTVMATLDDRQMQKLLRAPVQAEATQRAAPAAMQPSSRQPPSKGKVSSAAAAGQRLPVKALSSGSLRSVPSAGGAGSATSTPASAAKSTTKAGDDSEAQFLPFDEAVQQLGSDCAEAIELLAAKEWKSRADGAAMLTEMIAQWDVELATCSAEAVLAVLRTRPGFKESIFQVFNAMLGTLGALLGKSKTLTPRCAFHIISGIAPKLTEVKSKALVRGLLSTTAEFTGPKFVFRHLIQLVAAQKKPTLSVEALDWMCEALDEFAEAPVDAKAIVDFAVGYCFEQASPQIRQGAVRLVVCLRRRVGAKLDGFLSNVNPHLKATLETEIEKDAASQPNAAPTTALRRVREQPGPLQRSLPSGAPAGTGGKTLRATPSSAADVPPSTSSLDADVAVEVGGEGEDFPRTDISPQISACIKQMSSREWKDRLAAVKRVEQAVLAANRHIAPTGITDLLKTLKCRFDEPNKNFVIDALRVMRLVVESAGPAGARVGLKFVLASVLAMLGDQKTQLREEAHALAAVAFSYLGFDTVLAVLPKALAADTQVARISIVTLLEPLLAAQASSQSPNLKGVQGLVSPLLRLNMDRTAEVRSRAERLIQHVAIIAGTEFVVRAIADLKPAEQQQLRGLVEKLYIASAPPCPTMAGHPSDSSAQQTSAGGSAAVPEFGQPTARPTHHAQPRASTAVSTRATTTLVKQPPFTAAEIIAGVRSASREVAMMMCSDFMMRLRSGEESLFEDMHIIDVLFDRLASAFLSEQCGTLAHSLLEALIATFQTRVAEVCHTKLLYDCVGILYNCLLSDLAAADRPAIKGLNELMKALIDHSNPDELFSALMSRLSNYSSVYLQDPTKMNHKYVEITAKCIFRFRVQQLHAETIIMTSHECLITHPPSAFKDRDDLTIRTIKTILSDATRAYGEEILRTCVQMIGKQCLVYNFLQVCHTKLVQQEGVSSGSGTVHVAPGAATAAVSQTPQRHADPHFDKENSSSGPIKSADQNAQASGMALQQLTATSGGDDGVMATIFSKMKKHATADAGFEELYLCLRDEGDEALFADFDSHFGLCSDAFRAYVKRRMQRLMQQCNESFPLPGALVM